MGHMELSAMVKNNTGRSIERQAVSSVRGGFYFSKTSERAPLVNDL